MRRAALVLAALLPAGAWASSPAEAVAAAARDVVRQPAADRPHLRYFRVPLEGRAREDFRAAFRLHVNLLSREPEMADVVEVRPWLWRLDIREVGWKAAVLDRAAAIDPYFHAQVRVGRRTRAVHAPWLDATLIGVLARLTRSDAPVLDAPWFLAQTCRQVSLRNQQTGLGYYDVLGLRNRDDYFRLVGLDERASIRLKREVRAAVEFSGVSQQKRQVVRLQGVTGGAWVTLDTDDPQGDGDALRRLRRGELKFKAQEWYAPLSNGLPATLLNDEKGALQATAPDFIGGDDSPLREGRDARIHSNISCWSCHARQVLRPVDDFVRRTFTGNPVALGSVKKDVLLELRRQYLGSLDRWLEKDRAEYREAIQAATVTPRHPKGLDAGEAATAYLRAYHAYVNRPVTAEVAARELGVREEAWLAALRKRAALTREVDVALAAFLSKPPGGIARLTWEETFSLANVILAGGVELRR